MVKKWKRNRRRKRKNAAFFWALLLLFCLVLLLVAWQERETFRPEVERTVGQVRQSVQDATANFPSVFPVPPTENDAIQVYFGPSDPSTRNGIDDHLVSFLHSANRSIDAAFYDLGLQAAADALIAQHQRGVQVRLVSDSDYKDNPALQACVVAGIPLTLDNRSAFMHNKFAVVDGEAVWTGSMNITENGVYRNDNNALRIVSDGVALNFSTEFEEMFTHRVFGRQGSNPTPHPELTLGNTRIYTYFSPDDGVERAILAVLDTARERIDFAAFSFTSVPIAEAMADRMAQGVQVRGIFERRNAGSSHSRDDFLAERGAEIYLDTNPQSMHHKYIVVDAQTVITGSYNFSKNAETRNDENCLILHDAEIAKLYLAELDRMIGVAK